VLAWQSNWKSTFIDKSLIEMLMHLPFAHLWCLNALPFSETAELGGWDFGDEIEMIAESKKRSGVMVC